MNLQMYEKISRSIFLVLFLYEVIGAEAREPYHATVSVDFSSTTVSAPNLVDLTRDLKSSAIEKLFATYTPISPVSIDINLRGIEALTSFAAGSTTLVVEIPEAGTTETFTGATRDESLKLFKDFVRDGGRKHRLLRAYAKHSPIDPIAGNPNSLMGQMAAADYALGRLSPLSGCDPCWDAQPIIHQFNIGSHICRGFSGGFETTAVSLPLRYSYSPDYNWAFVIDVPFTYLRNGGASSIASSLGLALRMPIAPHWSLTPTLRFGTGGTLDLCTAGCFLTSGLISNYDYNIDGYVATLTNYVGYSTSTNFWLTGINYNYRLQNYVFKNGLTLTACEGFILYGRPLAFSLSFIDSYFTSHRLFINHYDEIGLSLIATEINPCLDYDCLSLGISYQFGEKKYHGYCFNLDYQF